eukprot:2773836-Prymnesium_polylepis.1
MASPAGDVQRVDLVLLDPGVYVVFVRPRYTHHAGLRAATAGGPCPDAAKLVDSVQVQLMHAATNGSAFAARAHTLPRCTHGEHLGRWLNQIWQPLHCSYEAVHATWLQQCAERHTYGKNRPLWLAFVGDSVMRGLFFDVLEKLLDKPADRSWGKAVTNGKFDLNTSNGSAGSQLDLLSGHMRIRMISGS